MKYRILKTGLGAPLLGTALAVANGIVAAEDAYEALPVLQASRILPPEVVSGPHHRVLERVTNDGFMNHYTISSQFGLIEVDSTAELKKRVYEMGVVAKLDALKGSEEFAKNLAAGAGDVVEGAKDLITQPVGTVSGAVSGVGKLFQRAGDNLFGDPQSDSEDSRLKGVIGYSATKRDYAKAFAVDVYSENPLLQDRLNDISWAGYSGGLTAGVALMAVPGGAGVAVSVTKNTDLMNEIDMSKPPTDLRRMNRQKLSRMGLGEDLISLFVGNTTYSPTRQTLLVEALNAMEGTANRGEFVRFAVRTDSYDVAFFRQRQAQMYAGFNRSVQAIARFVPVGDLAAALTADGALVFAVPTDLLVWTSSMERTVTTASLNPSGIGEVKRKDLWLAGGISERARAELERRGWRVQADAQSRLLGSE